MTKPELPPLLNPIEVETPFATAVKRVRQHRAGAGDLFWAPSQTNAEFAIVLEPDVDRQRAIEMLPLALVVLSDCLAVLLPPKVAIQFRDDQFIAINGGIAGGVEAAISGVENEAGIPEWLVLSINIEMRQQNRGDNPGLQPDFTTLDEEGWEQPDLKIFVETYARHFLSWMAAWDDDGFDRVARAWKFKAESESKPDMNAVAKIIHQAGS